MVTVSVPVRPDYLAILRTTTATVGAGTRLSIDAIDDLRIAVDEAFGLLALHGSGPRSATLELVSSAEAVDATIRMPVDPDRWPPAVDGSLAWRVIVALTDDASLDHRHGEGMIALRKRTVDTGQG